MRKFLNAVTACVFLLTLFSLAGTSPAAASKRWNEPLETIALPDGFRPEGIASAGRYLYVGSIPTGDVYRVNRFTGEGEIFVDAPDGRAAIGLEVDSRRGLLWVAGGAEGTVAVYDLRTGDEVVQVALPVPSDVEASFVNDVHVADGAAFITDSANLVFYRVDIDCTANEKKYDQSCEVGEASAVELGDEFEVVEGTTNANGIVDTPDRKSLLIIHSDSGILYRVDPTTGEADVVEVTDSEGEVVSLETGDGLFRSSETVWVVQNRLNQISELKMSQDGSSAVVAEVLIDEDFDIPTTATRAGDSLYAVNARFGIENPDEAEYQIVRVG